VRHSSSSPETPPDDPVGALPEEYMMIFNVISPLATPVDVVVTTISGSLVTSVTKDAYDTQPKVFEAQPQRQQQVSQP